MNQNQKRITCSFICLCVFVFLALGSTDTSTTSTSTSSQRAEPNPKDAIRPLIHLDFTWEKSGFDNVMIANFVINNQSGRDIKDITITCTHSAKSGTKIDDNTRTIYDVVKAKTKKRINQFNMGFLHNQAHSSSCRITDFEFN